jgi:hypothetical protein
MKAMWTTASGRSPFPFFLVLLRTVFYAPYSKPWKVIRSIKTMNHSGNPVSGHHFVALAVTFVLFALLSTFLVVWSRLALAGNDEAAPRVSRGRARFFLMAASLMILLYAVVDMFDSVGVQAWYTSQTLVAVGTLLYFMLRRLAMDRRAHGLYFIVALFGCANLVIFALSKPIDAAQESIPVLSASIKNAVGNAKIGISDAGIFNYVYGGDVINLDGLVNDEIVGYAPDHLPCYLADKKILYFMGFGLSSESAFNLEPITDYSTPVDVPVPGHTPVTIYRIDNARVKALPACKHR